MLMDTRAKSKLFPYLSVFFAPGSSRVTANQPLLPTIFLSSALRVELILKSAYLEVETKGCKQSVGDVGTNK